MEDEEITNEDWFDQDDSHLVDEEIPLVNQVWQAKTAKEIEAEKAVARDLENKKFELRKVALYLEQNGYMTFNDYWRFCEANKILMF